MKNKIDTKAIKALMRGIQCPECNGVTKRITRKNYPFGRKSKPIISSWKVCKKCGWTKSL